MYDGPIIDCDVHHKWDTTEEILPFMSREWHDYVKAPGRDGEAPMVVEGGFQNPHGVFREDSYPPNGGSPGSDAAFLASHLFDDMGITRAVLTYNTALFAANLPNPFFAAEVARAANAWTCDRWLPVDDRLYSSIVVVNQLPQVAAAEIRRMATNPRFVQVVMANNALTMPFGHPLMDPVHKAAAECDLPIALHSFSAGGVAQPPSALGYPNYYLEYQTLGCQNLMTHLVSFLVNGVFERYPDLHLVLVEGGCAWVPPLLWRLDEEYDRTPHELPALKRRPSEYVREHVSMTTQPLEAPTDPAALVALLASVDGEHIMQFATDYPHWDADEPVYIQDLLPESWHKRVFYQNAAELYGWNEGDLLPTSHEPRVERPVSATGASGTRA